MVAGSSSNVTPSGTDDRLQRECVADLQLAELVDDRLGDRGRKRFDVQLARELLEDAAFLDAGRVSSTPVSSSGTTAWIGLSRRTRSKIDMGGFARAPDRAGPP